MFIYKTYRSIICCHICLLGFVTGVWFFEFLIFRRFFQAKPPAAVPATVVMNNDAAVEDAEDFGSESSGEMKVRDQRHLETQVGLVFKGITGEPCKKIPRKDLGNTLGKT